MSPDSIVYPIRTLRSTRWVSIRARILERDDWTCQYCGEPAVCVDHILAFSLGGSDADYNLRASCAVCNHDARNRRFDSFEQKKAWLDSTVDYRAARREREYRRRHSFCACGIQFEPGVQGATAVLCPWCAAVDARRPIPAALEYQAHADGLEGVGVVIPIRPRTRRRT
jgi:hypothetical protein